MANCCEDKQCELTALRASHHKVLWIVLAINAGMFLAESAAGILAHSTSLLADALDMLGDALVYGFSLAVVTRPPRWQAIAAMGKGVFMLIFGLGVLVEAADKILSPVQPDERLMALTAGVALAANLFCFGLLLRYRNDNLNMRSTWLCSRNDLLANIGVLLAAAASALLSSRWPDILVGAAMACLFLHSAIAILRQSVTALRSAASPLSALSPIISDNLRHNAPGFAALKSVPLETGRRARHSASRQDHG
ncbi:cation diffusion facilitator family transporter [Martelella alba]|uniref:Cation transporter n=1 Tax=Martelella alba TaxID=2590451 RepID=A0ABY2SLM2_9HYPH|nr:cation diffusion facilitator family transporter [Martelella alba]TKI06674.1 cation transporter [Martelella alba]